MGHDVHYAHASAQWTHRCHVRSYVWAASTQSYLHLAEVTISSNILRLNKYVQVDIRVNEDAPAYPTTVDSSLVPLGRLPLGGTSDRHDPRPASEGGCSAGHLEGCHIYYIKVKDYN